MSKWEMVKLGKLGTIVTGNTPSTKINEFYENADIPFFKPSDLKNTYINHLKDAETYLDIRAEEKLRILPKNTVLVTCIGIIGKVGLTKMPISSSNQQINAIIPHGEKCHHAFLSYALISRQKIMQHIANAPVVPILNKTNFSNIQIPLPPLDLQKKIADELDKINLLITKRKEQLQKLDLLVKAKFVEMFGDPVSNPMEWKVKLLQKYIDFLTSGSRGWAQYFADTGKYFLTIKNVKNCNITLDKIQYVNPPLSREAERTKVQALDLLISITADLGRTGVVTHQIAEFGAYINQHLSLLRLKLDKLNPIYIAYYLETNASKKQFQNKNQSAVKAGLNFEAIKTLKILLPPIALQNEFASYVEKVEALKQKMQTGLSALEMLYKERMQEYFKN